MENVSDLDQILKNTEFENLQHLKAIDSEREKVQAYQQRIEHNEMEGFKLKEQAVTEEEKAARFRKQHVINKDNIESLKHTSMLLAEHEEALKRKLHFLQQKVEQEKLEQTSHVAKYEKVLAIYEAKYDNMEKVQLMRKRNEELRALSAQNNLMESRIKELKTELKAICTEKKRRMIPMILQIATLRVETDRNLAKLKHDLSVSLRLKEKMIVLRQDKAEQQMIARKGVDFSHNEDKGHLMFWCNAQSASIPLSETTSMPLSCSEPGEEAVQLPHPTTLNIKPVAASNPTSVQKKMSSQMSSVPCNDTVSSKPSSTSRFRLELPQFSTFSRKERINTPGDTSHKEAQLVPTTTQLLKAPASSLQSSTAKEQPVFQFKVPTKAVRRIATPTSTGTLHKGERRSLFGANSETMEWSNFAVTSTQSQAGVSTTLSAVSSASSANLVDINKQPNTVSTSTFLLENGAEREESNGSALPPTYLSSFSQETQKQQQVGRQEMEHSQPPGSIQEQQDCGQEPQQYDGYEAHADSGCNQELEYGHQLPATTLAGSREDLGYEEQLEPANSPASRQSMEFGREVAVSQEQLYGGQLAAGSQGFAPFGSDKNSFTFGGFGQDAGKNFGGGFGFFGSHQESSGTPSFGAGFSFGGSNSSQQNSGFSLNFGTSSDDHSSASSFFNF